MSVSKTTYSADTSITITLNSLAASTVSVGRASTAVDNTSNTYLDALVSLSVGLAAGTAGGDGCVYCYAYGTTNGTTYTEGVTGTDAGFTTIIPTGLKLIGVLPTPTQSITYQGGPWSVSAAFGGVLPIKWGLVVVNNSGIALASSACTADYVGITVTTV